MKVPDDVKCKICAAVFCCAKCREKHEDKAHKEAKAIRQICYICNDRPFPLRTDTKITTTNVLVEHILREHLPLRCNRCTKVFHTVADFKSIARCFNETHSKDSAGVESVCHLERNPNIPTIPELAAEAPDELADENKENIAENCSTDCSAKGALLAPPTVIKVAMKALSTSEIVGQPISKELRAIVDPPEALGEVNEAMLTPLSMINLRWKRKSRQSFDSMNNISAVNVTEGAVVVPTSPGKKLTRSTSTPMMNGCMAQNLKVGVNEESYTCGQMSSIHSNNSGNESDTRGHNTPHSPTSYEINKVRAIIRSKSKVAATPLRQVMSKSIQRAIAQHGYTRMIAPGTQRKMSFSSTGSLSSTSGSPSRNSIALDLRTTPVLKRTSSEGYAGSRNAKMIRLEAKSQSEDLSGGSRLNDSSSLAYYDTHQNAESLNQSTEMEEEQENHPCDIQTKPSFAFVQPLPVVPSCYNETPRVVAGGGILKKVISFSPERTTRLLPEEEEEKDANESSDVWATPCAIPTRSYSCSALKNPRSSNSLLLAETGGGDSSDDVFTAAAPVARSKSCKQLKQDGALNTGKLWTIVSNVIRLASRQDLTGSDDPSDGGGGGSDSDGRFSATSLAKKAVSFAGFLRNRFPSGGAQLPRRNSSSGSDEFSPSGRASSGGGGSGGSGIKRRRAVTVYARPYESLGKPSSSPLAKRKRIQGRQPIERMRTSSSRSGSGSDF